MINDRISNFLNLNLRCYKIYNKRLLFFVFHLLKEINLDVYPCKPKKSPFHILILSAYFFQTVYVHFISKRIYLCSDLNYSDEYLSRQISISSFQPFNMEISQYYHVIIWKDIYSCAKMYVELFNSTAIAILRIEKSLRFQEKQK